MGRRANGLGASGIAKLAVVGSSCLGSPLLAQAQPAENNNQVEEIVVTAQKRSQNLQDVPISIVAITADSAKAAGIETSLDIGVITPGLSVTRTANSPLLFLRGVGTALGTVGDEGGVNVVVDGVVFTSLPGSVFSMNNIDRIEVLRGPQGTLFGRNAAGGVISIITRDPRHDPGVDMSLSYGNYQTISTALYATAGITDTVAADIAVQNSTQIEGYGKNLFNGRDVNLSRDFSVRSKLLWESGGTSVRLSADYENSGGDSGIARQMVPGALGVGGAVYTGYDWNVNSNVQPRLYLRAGGGNIRVQQKLPWARITSISAYRKTDSGYDFDQDAGPRDIVGAFFHSRERQFTEELQLASLPSSDVQWIVGGFYLNNKAQNAPTRLSGAAFAPIGGFTERFGQLDTKSYAGFGQVTVPLSRATKITGGLRYTRDLRSYSFLATSGVGVITPRINRSKTFDKLTWQLAIDQNVAQDIMVYLSAGRGFKSGVFNILNGANPAIEPEVLTSFEGGFKSELFRRRLRLNLAGFYYKYNNIQVSQIVTGTALILNAAKSTIYGMDLDFDAVPFHGLTLSGGLEALHARYDKFLGAPGTFPAPATCTPTPGPLPGRATGGNVTCSIDASGKQMVRAPDFTASITGRYLVTTRLGDFGLSATYAHSSSFPFEADNRLRQPRTDLVNGEVSWDSSDRHLGLRLWARNLTKQRYYTTASSSLGDAVSYAPPRTYGFTLSSHF